VGRTDNGDGGIVAARAGCTCVAVTVRSLDPHPARASPTTAAKMLPVHKRFDFVFCIFIPCWLLIRHMPDATLEQRGDCGGGAAAKLCFGLPTKPPLPSPPVKRPSSNLRWIVVKPTTSRLSCQLLESALVRGFRSNNNFVLSMFTAATRIAQKRSVQASMQASKPPRVFEAVSKTRFCAIELAPSRDAAMQVYCFEYPSAISFARYAR
jgi:hypothetical protein